VLLGLLPPAEVDKVMRYVRLDDRKRALVSRLLQRAACAAALGLPFSAASIQRTKGSKPFLHNRPEGRAELANWNFNVSHEGRYVALAAEPLLVCGVDVAAPEQVRGARRSLEALFKSMESQLTRREWRTIEAAPTERAKEDLFRKYWSLKEAYTKARGDGIAFPLGKCDFHLDDATSTATVIVDGQPLDQWKFFLQPLPESHWVSVARGPPADIIDAFGAFKATFKRPSLPPAEMAAQLNQKEPSFIMKTIEELLPVGARDEYAALAEEGFVLSDDNSSRQAAGSAIKGDASPRTPPTPH